MDYSATLHDDEHPAGASPWGSPGSPQTSRTFSAATDPPSLQYRDFVSQTPSDGLAHEQEHGEGGFGSGEHEYRRPDTASTVSTTGDDARTEVPTPSHAGTAEGQRSSEQEQVPPSQESQDPSRTSDDAAASQGGAQARKAPRPALKLQAKITGLERTGRKDPILRFDVHVGCVPLERGRPADRR